MPRLSTRDMQAVLDLVGEAHHAEDLESFREHVLPSVRTLVPADWASYNELYSDGSAGVAIVTPDLPDWAYEVWARYAHQNPLVQRYQRTLDGRAYRFSDVIAYERLHDLDLYRELYRPFGIEHQIAVAMPAPPVFFIGLVLMRESKDFTEREREVLNLARPHLIQAYRNVEIRERLRGLVSALASGLDDSGEAAVVVDLRGVVAFQNRAGAAALAEATGAAFEPGERLPPSLAEWVADGAGTGTPMLLAEGGRRYVVRCVAEGALKILLFQSASRAVSRQVLEGLGLSAREAEVLQGMMRGLPTLEIAARMGITRGTVYKHAERIFAKLGVHDRVEAVAVAWAATASDGAPRRP
jgi:DNA-binding CsgD family transcriptional regulator